MHIIWENKSLYKHLNVDYKPEIFQKNSTLVLVYFMNLYNAVYLLLFQFVLLYTIKWTLNLKLDSENLYSFYEWTLLWALVEEFVSGRLNLLK